MVQCEGPSKDIRQLGKVDYEIQIPRKALRCFMLISSRPGTPGINWPCMGQKKEEPKEEGEKEYNALLFVWQLHQVCQVLHEFMEAPSGVWDIGFVPPLGW